jgi:hypothetical protein
LIVFTLPDRNLSSSQTRSYGFRFLSSLYNKEANVKSRKKKELSLANKNMTILGWRERSFNSLILEKKGQ